MTRLRHGSGKTGRVSGAVTIALGLWVLAASLLAAVDPDSETRLRLFDTFIALIGTCGVVGSSLLVMSWVRGRKWHAVTVGSVPIALMLVAAAIWHSNVFGEGIGWGLFYVGTGMALSVIVAYYVGCRRGTCAHAGDKSHGVPHGDRGAE